MRNNDSATAPRSIALGGGLAGLGVLVFSFSLPATVLALDGLDPYLIGIGRAAVAALLAAAALAAAVARPPSRRDVPGLLAVGLGVIFGFPVLSTLALDAGASAAHGGVVIGLLPAATAVFAALRVSERPSPSFWLGSATGALAITAFTVAEGGGTVAAADLLLVGALIAGGYGYAEGGRLARHMPGWQVISWALVLMAPITVPVTIALLAATPPVWTAEAAIGFGYVTAFSMYLGFFAWYAGMGRLGVAKAGQFQLAQPILTLVWSALLLGEHLTPATWVAAIAVVACVAWTQRARVRTAPPSAALRRPGVHQPTA
ncbi:DMT family transporter [Thermomonospora amylolytica]|uniref:DMT family transporter n=1 Tax=Thermomonospora amylolytica TaxID=1411117 RepID=UPI000E6D140F|nr:DMT family transporter [Thermomonospora amylolytica]